MSKSKKNTIDPENIIENYGADAVRFFILADSPPEKDIQWSETGMISAYKFVQKFWILNNEILNLLKDEKLPFNEELESFTNQTINRVNQALERFRYNVIIAVCHEAYSFFKKIVDTNKNFKNLKTNIEKILLIMMPIIPHISNECLKKLEFKDKVEWPKINQEYVEKDNIVIVIQINGKKRNIISLEGDNSEIEVLKKIEKSKLIEKYLSDKEIIKTIYVKNRLINYIIK
mgnify:CR=1 FL=1